ncbi:MAG: DM13 domain-containing protein [Phycisphaerales bacterium]
MNKRTAIIAVAGLAIAAAGWAAFRPELLFVDKRVNEPFPVASAAATRSTGMTMQAGAASGMGMSSGMGAASGMGAGSSMAPPPISPMVAPPNAATAIATGMFHSGAHETRGTATIHRLADGTRVLRFTDFETSNGPDVRVLLIAANDATDNDTVKASAPLELAPLKGNVGDQNYDIPTSVDLGRYRAVTIWCNRFNVNFGTAPLTSATQPGT